MAGDASYASVSLLLHGAGAHGATVVTDNSPTPKAVTVTGAASISTTQSKFGGSAIVMDGSTGNLQLAASTAFDLPGDFTLETFFYFTSYSASWGGAYGACLMANYLAGGANAGWQLRINGTAGAYNTINLYTGNTDLNAGGLAIALNTWHHVAVTRSGSTIRFFLNGALVGTVANSDTFTRSSASSLYIGRLNDGTFKFFLPGYVDELRITKGVARYTAAFAVPTAQFPDGIASVAGTVRNSANAPVARTVRLYRRDTGALVASGVSDAGTGAYSLYTPTLDEVSVICLDDAAGTLENDLIARVIPA